MQAAELEQRVARLSRAIGRAASDTASETRQTALEGLARLADELAGHRLRGDLAAIAERARAAGDWPESWRSVASAFARFAEALRAHALEERSER